jgi:hypothetical protein
MHAPRALQRGVMVDLLSGAQVVGPQAVVGGAGRQVPAGLAHVSHVPQETVEQQVLSTQLFDRQSLPARQVLPLAFFMVGPQTMAVQTLPVAQSVLPPQLVRQWPALQA